ncbi:MAG: helix-turn-helix domain-containing protein [Phycisphaeraceae bacterium]|nr:MAG: helix-turn-helix domain-containing protein [Phycisphaeraceae bacterium]
MDVWDRSGWPVGGTGSVGEVIAMNETSRSGVGAVRSLGWGRFPKALVESGVWGALTGSARAVLGVLIAHANARGECWPSRSTIARGAGVNIGTVRRAIRELCERGAIVVLRVGGHGRSTLYAIPSIAQMNPDDEGGRGAPVDGREGRRPRAERGAPARRDGRARAPQTDHKRESTPATTTGTACERRRSRPRWLTPELEGRLALVARSTPLQNPLVIRRLRERYETLAAAIDGGLATAEEFSAMDPRAFAALLAQRAVALPPPELSLPAPSAERGGHVFTNHPRGAMETSPKCNAGGFSMTRRLPLVETSRSDFSTPPPGRRAPEVPPEPSMGLLRR